MFHPDPKVYALLSAPSADAPRLVELALSQGSAGKRLQQGLLNYYRKVSQAHNFLSDEMTYAISLFCSLLGLVSEGWIHIRRVPQPFSLRSLQWWCSL